MATLLDAALTGDFKSVRELTLQKADINEQTKDGFTALALCVRSNHSETFNTLLAAGADVNVTSHDGFAPLTLAARHGHVDMVKGLLDSRAKLDAETKSGGTALMWAAHNGHSEVVQGLLRAKAVVRRRALSLLAVLAGVFPWPRGSTRVTHRHPTHSDTCLCLCVSCVFLSPLSQVDHVNQIGLTALIFASQNGYHDTVDVRDDFPSHHVRLTTDSVKPDILRANRHLARRC